MSLTSYRAAPPRGGEKGDGEGRMGFGVSGEGRLEDLAATYSSAA